MKMNVRNRSGLGPVCCIGLALLSSCNPVAHRFTEVTADAGIDFMYNGIDKEYKEEVEKGVFPDEEHSFHIRDDVYEALLKSKGGA